VSGRAFQQLALEAGARQPEVLANALLLLMDGAYIAARMYGASTSSPAADIATAARQVIDAQCEGKIPPSHFGIVYHHPDENH